MDTRQKITPLTELAARLANQPWLAVVGLFDPLTVTQAKRLAALANSDRKLLAVVVSDGETLLPAEARAALIAALRGVELVTIAPSPEWRRFIPSTADIEFADDPEAEKARSAEFVQFILNRQASGQSRS